MQDNTFADMMVLEGVITKGVQGSVREMWFGREFPDDEAF